MKQEELKNYIRDIPDFPKAGIIFKDITPLLKNKEAFRTAVELIAKPHQSNQIDIVAGIESRGFIIASAVAFQLNAGFVPIRKPGKLPYRVYEASYQLEYGEDKIQIHQDAIQPGQRVLLIDDLLATGGTVAAAIELINKLNGKIIEIAFLIELAFLNGAEKIRGYPYRALIRYE